MSWHFLREGAAASWEGACLDGAPSALSSLLPTLEACSLPASETATLSPSPSGMMYAPSTASHGGGTSTSSPGASPARISASQGRVLDSTASAAGSGERWPASLARWDPDTSSWKTPQLSLLGGLESFSETWPQWGSMRNGECWARMMPALPTSESASGFLLPTLTVCGNYNRKGASAQSGDGLATALAKMATLCARDYRHPGRSRIDRTGSTAGECPPQQVGGPLNPPWCEWFMGWPVGWTESKPLEMARFRQWLRLHGIPCAPERDGEP